jgi:hypothetical protein
MIRLDQLPNQQPDEQVSLFLHRHWIMLAQIFGVFAVLTLVPAVLAAALFALRPGLLENPLFGPVATLALSAYYLGVWLVTFFEYVDYELDVWIVTNERIIDIEQRGLFNRITSELHLANIQDVTAEVHGIVHTFFDYGNVYVQTAGEVDRFTFKGIPHPDKVKETIIQLSDADKRRHGIGTPEKAV